MADENENVIDVRSLDEKQLDQLSDEQVAYVQDLALRRQNPKLHARVKEAIKDKDKEIFQALSSAPFVYIGPEIEIIPGFKMSLRTLYSSQQDDAMEASTEFIRQARSKGGNSDLVNTVHMSKCFLAHAIETLNGLPFGGVQLQRTFFDVAMSQPAEAMKVLVDLRTKRMQAIAMIPQHVLQMAIEANQIFQATLDGVTRIGNAETADTDAKRIVEAVGNSTGPQVAGQKPI